MQYPADSNGRTASTIKDLRKIPATNNQTAEEKPVEARVQLQAQGLSVQTKRRKERGRESREKRLVLVREREEKVEGSLGA